jgi:hypothetical protein
MRQLLPHEIRLLKVAFLDAFPDKASLEMLFTQELPGRTLDANALAKNLTDIVLNLIGKAQKEGWLMRLVDAAIKVVKNNPLLEDAARQLRPLRDLEEKDHYNVCFLSASQVLVNRTDLRDALKQLESTTPLGFRVLKVDGLPLSGKTYSKELISYLYETRGSFEPVWIDSDEYVKTGITPKDLAVDIISKMGLEEETVPATGQEQDARWVRTFCNRLIGKLRNNTTNWWIVIDGFNKLVLPPAVNDLIHGLARASMKDLPRLRIILLGYPDELPDLSRYMLEEKIKQIEREDLVLFFIQLYEEIEQPFDTEKVMANVADVLQEIDPRDPRRIERLGEQTARVAKSVIS